MQLFSGNINKVIVSQDEVDIFIARWPCCNLRSRSYWFEFNPENNDLVDTDVPQQDDGQAAISLSQDAQSFWKSKQG